MIRKVNLWRDKQRGASVANSGAIADQFEAFLERTKYAVEFVAGERVLLGRIVVSGLAKARIYSLG